MTSNPERPDHEQETLSLTRPTLHQGSHSMNDADEVTILGICLDKFAEAAPLAAPDELKRFLPDAPANTVQFVLIELIKYDMAVSAESGQMRMIEAYVDALPNHLPIELVPIDLVMEEIQLRRDIGDTPKHAEYKSRFPKFDSMIAPLLGVSVAVTATVKKNRTAPPELDIGSQIDDFLIIQSLGSGAFAHVYLARQLSMHRLVALKVSRGTGDEPQALSQLDHVNIVRIYDQRRLADQSVHLLYMQFHPGGTLADVVKRVRQAKPHQRSGAMMLDAVDRNLLKSAQVVPDRSSVRKWLDTAKWPTVVAWLGVQLARALDEAHQRDVLHRDVKPANVLLSAEAIPKLADFNVSFAGAAVRTGAASSLGGSVGYMSPEHLRAICPNTQGNVFDEQEELVGKKADLYSLGILLWELWQGERPFCVDEAPGSWSHAVEQQLAARNEPLVDPQRQGNASERVLESTLKRTLQFDREQRPASGAELAGRLKLALHPDAAGLFDPNLSSWRHRIAQWSPWAIPTVVLLVPNLFVMGFNYAYNKTALLSKHEGEGLKEYFDSLALVVTLVLLAVGVSFLVLLTKPFVAAMKRAASQEPVGDSSIRSIVHLGQNAAITGGALWAIAGLIYPIALWFRFPSLPSGELVRFFFSLVICGGVASIYPFFGMTILSTLVYYPRLIKNTMIDKRFGQRSARLLQQTERFWLAAVSVPLLGVALLIFSDAQEKIVVLSAVSATAVGSILALRAYTIIRSHWEKMATVLSEKDASVIPGLGRDE